MYYCNKYVQRYFMLSFKKKENKQLSLSFKSSEFECGCNKCETQYLEEELVQKLQKVRDIYKKPIKITSGYRCPTHNKNIGGAKNSSHVSGMAADIQPNITTLDELDELYDICYTIFDNIGDGRNRGFIHVDTRSAKSTGKRTWIY